jgi:hypothetical protein
VRLPGGAVGIDLRAALEALLDAACGLSHLHSLHIAHGGVRAENVLLKSDASRPLGWTAKLGGFGSARILGERGEQFLASRPAGSVAHLAPGEALVWPLGSWGASGAPTGWCRPSAGGRSTCQRTPASACRADTVLCPLPASPCCRSHPDSARRRWPLPPARRDAGDGQGVHRRRRVRLRWVPVGGPARISGEQALSTSGGRGAPK